MTVKSHLVSNSIKTQHELCESCTSVFFFLNSDSSQNTTQQFEYNQDELLKLIRLVRHEQSLEAKASLVR